MNIANFVAREFAGSRLHRHQRAVASTIVYYQGLELSRFD
jgi:hypothetical protein